MNFNAFCRAVNLNEDREDFWYFMRGVSLSVEDVDGPLPERTLEDWNNWLDLFFLVCNNDAADLHNTQHDALGTLF